MKLVRSPKPEKKWRVVFDDGTHTDFGQQGASDYTKHKDVERRNRYIRRHLKDLRGNPKKAGYLSMFVLWNKPSLQASWADYKARFRTYQKSGRFPTRIDQYRSIPFKYVPRSLSIGDRRKQVKAIRQARRSYSKQVYVDRPQLKSFKGKESPHVRKAKRQFGVESMNDLKTLSRKSGCPTRVLKAILKKGRGAYYSSGSRPNQTADSWAKARLASALTGGKASKVDAKELSMCR